MKNFARKIIAIFGRAPYTLMANAMGVLVKAIGVKADIWPRNSYALRTLEPGYSDLDFTLYLKNNNNTKGLKNFTHLYQKLNKIIPLLGEINIYTPSTIEFIAQKHNGLELARDPKLCQIADVKKNISAAEASVFLFRMMELDIHNLKERPERRVKKWKAHIEAVDQLMTEYKLTDFVPFKADKLIETGIYSIIKLNDIWDPFEVNDLKDKLECYFELVNKKVEVNKIKFLIDSDAWFSVWFSRCQGSLEPAPRKLSEKQINFFKQIILWEVCGVLTQINSKESVFAAVAHFEKLAREVQRIAYLQASEAVMNLIEKINEASTRAKKIKVDE